MITNITQATIIGREHALRTIETMERPFSWDDVPSPLSGEWAGESIPEIFGSWDNATEARMEAYEAAYLRVFVLAELADKRAAAR